MQNQIINSQDIVNINSMRFKTLVAEGNDEFNLKLTREDGIQGFIVFLRPSLPSIY